MKKGTTSMTSPRRILCSVDFSKPSDGAYRYAIELSRALEAEMHLAHVYSLPIYSSPDGMLVPSAELVARQSQELAELLAKQAALAVGVKVVTHLVQGVAHREIARLAKELSIDLVVMGTHGRSGVRRFFLGSVAERVVRTVPAPVIAVPARGEKPPEHVTPPRSILVACDFSDPSRRAIEAARELHARLHSAVVLVHVEQDVSTLEWTAPPAQRDRHAWIDDRLRELASDIFGPDAQMVQTRVLAGQGPERILEVARQLECDLLVVGSSGKNAVDRLLLGSTTNALLRTSPMPVLVVH
jgi:nucleotide-binding universal stress UspA family protein